jgi:hypothetical protein
MIRKQRPTFSSAELDLQLSQVSGRFHRISHGLPSLTGQYGHLLTFSSRLTPHPERRRISKRSHR